MEFTRLYPVELVFQGIVTGQDGATSQEERIDDLRESFVESRPDLIIESVEEVKGFKATSGKDYVYKVKGFTINPPGV